MEEGISHEAAALAGHQQLGNLIVLYDDNNISIEDDTNIAKSEDIAARYEAYGWHVQRLSWRQADGYHEDVQALYEALQTARQTTTQPSFISLRTIIAWPAPHAQNTGAAHGAALGADEVAATKKVLGFDPAVSFPAAGRAGRARAQGRRPRQAGARRVGRAVRRVVGGSIRSQRELLDRLIARRLPDGWTDALPEFPPDEKGVATRKASGAVLNALAPVLPELWGGSADLAGSNDTTMKGEPSFIPEIHQTKMFPGNIYGRTLHFGIREHAMGAILNGIALHGLTRPYGGTFLVFSDYMRGSVRLAALMGLPVTYVWTHDSIGLGEDGPTHQPVEHLWALRAIPGLDVVRPGDANETVGRLANHPGAHRPPGRPVPQQAEPAGARPLRRRPGLASAEGTARGGYVLADADGGRPRGHPDRDRQRGAARAGGRATCSPTTASGQGGLDAVRRVVRGAGRCPTATRCCRRQSGPGSASRRASPWAGGEFVGDAGRSISLEHFGASADYKKLYEEFGITADSVAEAARDSLASVAPGNNRNAS